MSKNELTTTTATFKNPTLNALTNTANSILTAFGEAKNTAQVNLAKVFYTVASSKAYEEDGFSSASDYVMETFGASKANAYAYIQVGGAIANKAIPTADASGKDFNFTQLRAMVSTKNTKALAESVENGDINADMSSADISEKVKVPKPKANRPAKRYRFAFIAYKDGNPEVVELGTYSLDEFRGTKNALDEHGYMCYAEFAVDGTHHFLYTDGSTVPVALVKAYDLPKQEKK